MEQEDQQPEPTQPSSFQTIHNLAVEYYDTRRKHIDQNWLSCKSVFSRVMHPYSGGLKSLWEADINESKEALDLFRNKINSQAITVDDLKDYLIHLKTHNFKISDRNHFLLLFPAVTAAVILLVTPSRKSMIIGAIFAVIGILMLNERAALYSLKIVNDEVVTILEREIERKTSSLSLK